MEKRVGRNGVPFAWNKMAIPGSMGEGYQKGQPKRKTSFLHVAWERVLGNTTFYPVC